MFEHLRDRVLAVARERAAEEADGAVLSPAEAAAFDQRGERSLLTRDDMAGAISDGLDDIEELLLQDVTPREAWAGIRDERVLRREIARVLRDRAANAYTVDQEAATADEKETDIRLRSTASAHHGVIELKIGDKDRSAADLRDALKSQLVGKYMASEQCRAGCLLISLADDRGWTHPSTNARLDLTALIDWLNGEARTIADGLGGAIRLEARGLDLRPRLKTEREARQSPPSDRRGATEATRG